MLPLKSLNLTVADVNEAPLFKKQKWSLIPFGKHCCRTTIATSSATDAEADKISYSLAGTGSDLFKVDEKGTVTLASAAWIMRLPLDMKLP